MKSILTQRNMKIVRKLFYALLLLCLLASANGCANQATASLMPGADLSRIKSFYLIPGAEDKDNYKFIKTNLEKRGYKVTTGPEILPPYKSDAVLTYVDKWSWDITPFMMELTIAFRDPINNTPVAVGHSLHSSLCRKSEEEMVDEVLTNIFNAKADSVKAESQPENK